MRWRKVMMGIFMVGLLLGIGSVGLAQDLGMVLEDRVFQSEAMGEAMRYSIYLPPGYQTSERSYPVIYLLNGAGGDNNDWIRYGNIAHVADQLILRGEIFPFIIVMPDGGKNSMYVNWPDGPNWEDYILETVEYIDAHYRTIPERLGTPLRGIGGLSMGGYGALSLAFKHPDVFTAAASLSGALIPGRPPEEMAATFPEFAGPFGVPFDPELWDKSNPFNLIENIRGTKLQAYIVCGDDDDYGLYIGAARLHEALVQALVPHEYRIYDGIHRWTFWSAHIAEVLRWFNQVLTSYY